MLELIDLHRRFGDVVALDGVSFTVPDGAIVGFVGPNGAGKTTAMRIALGVLEPDEGEVRWRGRRVDAVARRRFGYMPEERGLYPKMKVHDQLVYLARLHGLARTDAERRADEAIDVLGVADRRDDRVETLSLGNQQRVQLAAALVHEPDALVLDEPFSGLDPVGVDVLAAVLRRQSDNHGVPVVFSSHQLELIERVCDSVVLIDRGRIVASGTIDELRASRARRLLPRGGGGSDDARLVHGGLRACTWSPRSRAASSWSWTTAPTNSACWTWRERGATSRTSAGPSHARRAVPRGSAGVSERAPAATDRGAWLVVARRDFRVRLRDKGFVISTAITIAVLSVFILIRAYGGGGTPRYDLGVVGGVATASRRSRWRTSRGSPCACTRSPIADERRRRCGAVPSTRC